MTSGSLQFHNLSFSYLAGGELLFSGLELHFPRGWTGIVGANGAGKTTLLKLAVGQLQPLKGSVTTLAAATYCDQRTDTPPQSAAAFLEATDGAAVQLKGQLAIATDWLIRWNTLSHGERKRLQIGTALWTVPDLLALDEPTNHLDHCTNLLLQEALRSFRGIGLMVSHDRELLDSLCGQCAFVEAPTVGIKSGGVTAGLALLAAEKQHQLAVKTALKRDLSRLQEEATRRAQIAASSRSRLSKKKLNRHDSDTRWKIDSARLSGKDKQAGQVHKQLQKRLNRLNTAAATVFIKREYSGSIWLPGNYSKRALLAQIPAGKLPLSTHRALHFPDLLLRPRDRIAVTGPNGSGKTTLLQLLLQKLLLPQEQLLYLPQEITLENSQQLLGTVRQLSHSQLGWFLSIVSRLGSRPAQLLESAAPSPGEIRKLWLALGLLRKPQLIILDEPTNHLDLPSIQHLEEALTDCPCGLVLVSHDLTFLRKQATSSWNIRISSDDACGTSILTVSDSLSDLASPLG